MNLGAQKQTWNIDTANIKRKKEKKRDSQRLTQFRVFESKSLQRGWSVGLLGVSIAGSHREKKAKSRATPPSSKSKLTRGGEVSRLPAA